MSCSSCGQNGSTDSHVRSVVKLDIHKACTTCPVQMYTSWWAVTTATTLLYFAVAKTGIMGGLSCATVYISIVFLASSA